MSDPLLQRRTGTTVVAAPSRPLLLELGGELSHVEIAWESYGRLDADGSNVILLCHALTGSAHAAGVDAAGKRGWWDDLIGPGRALDTNRWFVLSSNILGSRYGSTGPCSIDPATGCAYGDVFPAITIGDIVEAQGRLLDELGIDRVASVVGGSLGGMQALEWGARFAGRVASVVSIAAGARQTPWAIAFASSAREAIELGRRAGDVEAGLRLARKGAMVAYRSHAEFERRFGRERAGTCFAVESWLDHHGRRLVERFDAESYLRLIGAMAEHDIARRHASAGDLFASWRQPTLIVGISSDVLYPAADLRPLADAIPSATYAEIHADTGHDSFLIATDQVDRILSRFLAEHEEAITTFTPAACADILEAA